MKKVFIMALAILFFLLAESGYAFQAVKTFASGFSCLAEGKTREQVEWEALFNATKQARENAISSGTSMAWRTANVDIVRTISENWERNDMGQECFISKIEAAVMPKGEETIGQRQIRMRGLHDQPAMRGVSKDPLPVKITASDNINPGDDGKPLSVAVHVYQLKDSGSFNSADLKKLYTNPESVLGSGLIGKQDITIEPGRDDEITVDRSSGAKYLGVAAFYKDYKKNPPPQWKQAVSISPAKGYEIDSVNVQLADVKVSADVKKSKVEEPAPLPPPGPEPETKTKPEPGPKLKPEPDDLSSGKYQPSLPPCYTSKQTGDIEIRTEKFSYYEGDNIKVSVKAKRDLYALIVYKDVGGNEIQILPNQFRKDNFLKAGMEYVIPDSLDNFHIRVKEPFGLEHIYVYASTSPTIGNGIQRTLLRSGQYKLDNFTSSDNSTLMRSIELVPEGGATNIKDNCKDYTSSYPTGYRSISIEQEKNNYKDVRYDCKIPVVEYFQSETCIETKPESKRIY